MINQNIDAAISQNHGRSLPKRNCRDIIGKTKSNKEVQENKLTIRQKRFMGIKSGQWNLTQNFQYYKFLKLYTNIFNDPIARRTKKIFQKMAKIIKTRNAIQCRSHHQKLENKGSTTNDIIKHLEKAYNFCPKEQFENDDKIKVEEKTSDKLQTKKNFEMTIRQNKIFFKISQNFMITW